MAAGPTFFRLLSPRVLALRNAWQLADRSRKGAYLFFGGLTLGFWVCVLAVCIYFLSMFQRVELFGPLLLRKALSMLLLSFSGLLFFSNVVTALSSYFLSEDMQLIQALPISLRRVFYFRFADTLLGSSWMILIFGLPVLLAYGIVHHGGPLFYLIAFFGLGAWLLPPAALGVMVANLLVRGFSARRIRELAGLVGGVFMIVLLLVIRGLRPERLVDAQAFETLAEFIAVVRAPDAAWLPSTWLTDTTMWALGLDADRPQLSLALLFFTGPAMVVLCRWLTAPLWFEAWTRAQEAPRKAASRSVIVNRLIDGSTAWLQEPARALLRKDIRIFLREPGQWTQGMMLLGLIVIYLYSVRSLPFEAIPIRTTLMKNAVAFLNVGVAGAVLAALSVRFHFIAVSQEGRAFWLMHSSPVSASGYLRSKFVTGLVPTVIVGELLVLSTNAMLGVEPIYAWIAGGTIACLSVALCGLAVGLGATFPNFRADSAARMASGPGAILFMVVALIFVTGVITVQAVPVGLLLARQYRGEDVGLPLWIGLGCAFAASIAACVAATVLPMRRGARVLWGDTGNVGD